MRLSSSTAIAVKVLPSVQRNPWSSSAYTTQGASLLLLAICLIGLQLPMDLLAQGYLASAKLLSPWQPLAGPSQTHPRSLSLSCLHAYHTHTLTLADRETETGKLSWRRWWKRMRRVILRGMKRGERIMLYVYGFPLRCPDAQGFKKEDQKCKRRLCSASGFLHTGSGDTVHVQ